MRTAAAIARPHPTTAELQEIEGRARRLAALTGQHCRSCIQHREHRAEEFDAALQVAEDVAYLLDLLEQWRPKA